MSCAILSHCKLCSRTMKAYIPIFILLTILAVEGKWIANPTNLQSVNLGTPKIRNLVRISLVEQAILKKEKDFWPKFLRNVEDTLQKSSFGRIT